MGSINHSGIQQVSIETAETVAIAECYSIKMLSTSSHTQKLITRDILFFDSLIQA